MDSGPVCGIPESIIRSLLSCGLVAPLAMVGFVVGTILLTSDHSFLSATISQLGTVGRPYAAVINSGFMFCGALVILFAWGLYWRLGGGWPARLLWLLLTVDGIGTILIGIYHADSVGIGAAGTFEGFLHSIIAGVAYLALVISMVVFAVFVGRTWGWRGWMLASLAVVIVNSAILLLLLLGYYEAFRGAMQLAFFGTSMVWMTAVSAQALRWRPAFVPVEEDELLE